MSGAAGRRSDDGRERARASAAGYSLLEVMIVLAILAAASAMAMPGLLTGLDAAMRQTTRLDLAAQLQTLRREAFARARPIVVTAGEAVDALQEAGGAPAVSPPSPARSATGGARDRAVLILPMGQSLRFEQPLTIAADGSCSLTRLRLLRGARQIAEFTVEAAGCRLVAVSG